MGPRVRGDDEWLEAVLKSTSRGQWPPADATFGNGNDVAVDAGSSVVKSLIAGSADAATAFHRPISGANRATNRATSTTRSGGSAGSGVVRENFT